MPSPPLGSAAFPVTLVPILLPATLLPVELPERTIPASVFPEITLLLTKVASPSVMVSPFFAFGNAISPPT